MLVHSIPSSFAQIENHPNLAFDDVSVSVDRIVDLMASGNHHTVLNRTKKQKFPGVPKSTSYVGENAQFMALPLPISVVPTTSGSLISCSYRACVELSAGLFTNNARLVVPLTIYAAPPPHEAYSMAPPVFWQPQLIAPAVEVAVGVPVVAMQNPGPSAPPDPSLEKRVPNPTYAGAVSKGARLVEARCGSSKRSSRALWTLAHDVLCADVYLWRGQEWRIGCSQYAYPQNIGPVMG
ncbi:hypothetical protein Vretimale_11533 [Volvox reticuliferus]|uniref:Uncharacterized protein n=1 Tax=Volvox reticuliferus TaxID=1737510 RepID=A0A8J4CQP1_9CHLO|nr:hypothetical protein Vretifemale_14906 [Volvox reticuliferus]GIM07376.1 hypothetical protein Vretimale_11533 [Volvox reticuliferus]